MRDARAIAAVAAFLALAVPLPAVAAAGTTPITWTPLPAVEPGAQVTLSTDDLPALFAAGCGSGPAVQVSVAGQPVTAANLDWAILLTLPLSLRPGAQLVVSAPACHAVGSQVLTVAQPVIATATAQIVTEAGGQETATAGQTVTVTGTGFGVAQGPGYALLLAGQPCGCQIEGWGAGVIEATLPQTLATGAYSLAVRTSVGTSPGVPLYVLSVADAQALAAGKPVTVPWASSAGTGAPQGGGGADGSGAPSGGGQGTPPRSGTGSHAGGRPGAGGRGAHAGGSEHGVAWPWLVLVGLASVAAAVLALPRRPRRVGAGAVQVQTPEPEPEAQAAEPEAGPETGPEGGDAP